MLQRIFRHLRVIGSVESTIVEARLRIFVRRTALLAFAGLIAVFGLLMLNATAFLALKTVWGPAWAAAAAAIGDFVIAAVIVAIALATRSSAELRNATDLRQAAIDGIENELSALRDQSPWRYAAAGALETGLPAVLVTLITAIVRGLRKNKQERQ